MSELGYQGYEAFIGMEVHAELLTQSKMFCGCRNAFGGEPNTRCCPVCLGMPGALPVINRQAVSHVIRTALALNCTINRRVLFDRKNYFYPDLPKGYQISQYELPIGVGGWLDVEVEGVVRRVRIRRVHLEEDTGKLMHLPGGQSAVDFNRSGVPLMEIVTEFPPDMRTAAEARAYLMALRAILTFIGVSDGRMEQGSLRCEPNLSVRPVGSEQYGVKTEIKNLNSFRAVQRGIEYEIDRQVRILQAGGVVTQETRGWNEERQQTVPQRTKEEEQEYRYFPDPDLVPLLIDDQWIADIQATMPELPAQARERLIREHGLSESEAAWLTQSPAHADYFGRAVQAGATASEAATWIMGDLARLLNAAGHELEQSPVTPEALARLTTIVREGRISGRMAKEFLERMFETGRSPDELLKEAGGQISDPGALKNVIDDVIAAEPDVWKALLAGDTKKLTYLMGQVMKATRGKANPQEARRLLEERIQKGE